MKRVLICAVAAAALVVPMESLGADARQVYRGDFDGISGSKVKMKVAREDGDSAITSFFVRNVPVDCENGTAAMVQRAGIRGTVPIGNRKGFRVKDDDGDSTFKVLGRAGLRKSFGKFRYFGELDVDGRRLECDTGRLEWDAR